MLAKIDCNSLWVNRIDESRRNINLISPPHKTGCMPFLLWFCCVKFPMILSGVDARGDVHVQAVGMCLLREVLENGSMRGSFIFLWAPDIHQRQFHAQKRNREDMDDPAKKAS